MPESLRPQRDHDSRSALPAEAKVPVNITEGDINDYIQAILQLPEI